MRVVVIDGQGGGLGRSVVEKVRETFQNAEIVAVGTNALATQAMLKAGADAAATGENAVCYNCAHADVIIGALGIGFANSMHGEISPAMARAVSESAAHKLLIPIAKCSVHVIGVADKPMALYVAEAIHVLRALGEDNR